MTYTQKYFEDLFRQSILDAYENNLISHSEDFLKYINNRQDISNFYVLTLSILADTIEDVYFDMTEVYESNKINLASGKDLDTIGEMIGCPRPLATKSMVLVRFETKNVDKKDRVIDEGVILHSNTNQNFKTLEKGVIRAGETIADVCAESIQTGTKTRILSNSIVSIMSGVDLTKFNGLNVYNQESSSGGNNVYTDEEYRELLLHWVRNNIRGSYEAYERFFSDFNGLDGYKLIPNWNGSGTLKIVLDPGYPYQLLDAYKGIKEKVCQLPDDITMWSPTRIMLNVYCTVNVDIDRVNPYSSSEKNEIKSRIVKGIKDYVNGDVLNRTGLGIGEDFVPYKLGVYLAEAVPEVTNVSFLLPSDLDSRDKLGVRNCSGNEVVEIKDEEIAYVDEEHITVVME